MEQLFQELLNEIKKLNNKVSKPDRIVDFEPVDRTRLVPDDATERTMKDVFNDYMASQSPSRIISEMSQALDNYEDEEGIENEIEDLSDVDPLLMKEAEELIEDYKSGKLKKKEGNKAEENKVEEKEEIKEENK